VDYAALKSIHVTAVAVSGAGFVARGIGSLSGAGWVRSRAARTLPHLVDTLLLASAVALAWTLRLSPLSTPWLATKIACLVAYVALGSIALRRGPTPAIRAGAWIAALAVFGHIVAVAVTKQPLGLLGS